MRVLYVLPKSDYFTKGARGRVSHAVGVAEGLAGQGADICVLSGTGAAAYLHEARAIEIPPQRRWFAALHARLEHELDVAAPTAVIVRYATSGAFRFMSLMRRRRDVHWCFEVNSFAYHQFPRWPAPARRALLRLETTIVDAADTAYVVSAPLRECLARSGDPAKILVVPNGGPEPTRPCGSHPDVPLRLVYFGVYQSYYNMQVVIEGFRRARDRGLDATLHFHGDGPQRERISAAVGDGIHEHGRYRLDQLLGSELDPTRTVLLLPFDSAERHQIGSPIKMHEYMSTGLPIIGSRVPALSSTLTDGESALLVEPDDPDAWAAAMLRLTASGRLRDALGRGVRAAYPVHTWTCRMATLHAYLRERLPESNSR